jgi:hypothetical protein
MPEGVLAPARPASRTDLRESSDLVTTLRLAGRGVYRSANDGYGRNGKTSDRSRSLSDAASSDHHSPNKAAPHTQTALPVYPEADVRS